MLFRSVVVSVCVLVCVYRRASCPMLFWLAASLVSTQVLVSQDTHKFSMLASPWELLIRRPQQLKHLSLISLYLSLSLSVSMTIPERVAECVDAPVAEDCGIASVLHGDRDLRVGHTLRGLRHVSQRHGCQGSGQVRVRLILDSSYPSCSET